MLLLGLDVLLDVVEGLAALCLEIFQLLNHLSEHTLLQETIHELFMFFWSVETGKDFH